MTLVMLIDWAERPLAWESDQRHVFSSHYTPIQMWSVESPPVIAAPPSPLILPQRCSAPRRAGGVLLSQGEARPGLKQGQYVGVPPWR